MGIVDIIVNALPEALGGMIATGIIGAIAYLINKWNSERPVKSKKILHNLPRPDYKEFIGRHDELQLVIDGLTSRSYLISISGIGGIGKSALALEVSHNFLKHSVIDDGKKLAKKHYYDAIIWTSAKRHFLRIDRIDTREQEIRFQDILNTIAIVLGKENLTDEPQSKKKELIRKELTKRRVLIIIDNLETIDDEQLMQFLREIPEPSKAIITTRKQISETYSIHLPGLSKADAYELMQKEAAARGINLNEEQMERLLTRSGGVPLAIVWNIARMENYPVDDVLTSLHMDDEAYSQIAHFCFYEVVDSLKTKQSYHMLLALSLFSSKTTRKALGYITGFPPPLRDTTLVELEKLSLINKTANKFWMLPLTREFVTEELNRPENEELKEKLKNQFADYYNSTKIKKVDKTTSTIQAIHFALDTESIMAWNDAIFDYLEANFQAIERGVKITRIFFLSKSTVVQNDVVNSDVKDVLDTQKSSGVNVKVLWKEELDKENLPYPPDMIIFDQQEIHIHEGSGGWYTDVEIIETENVINKWTKKFNLLEKYSHEW